MPTTLLLARYKHKLPVPLKLLLEWHWKDYLISFEGYLEDVGGLETHELILDQYQVVTHKGWVAGVRRTLPYPHGVYMTPQHLLSSLWGGLAPEWAHHGPFPQHPLVEQVPGGFPGQGVIVVKNTALLTRGNVRLRSNMTKEEQDKYLQQAEVEQLRLLGYKPKRESP